MFDKELATKTVSRQAASSETIRSVKGEKKVQDEIEIWVIQILTVLLTGVQLWLEQSGSRTRSYQDRRREREREL